MRPMHVVECPSCASLLKVPSPVSGARLKCRKCGAVFLGTSRPAPDPAPVAPAPATPLPRPVRTVTYSVKPPENNNAIYIGIGAAVVLIALIVAVYATLRAKNAPVPEPEAKPEVVRPSPPPPPPPAPPPSRLFPVSAEPAPDTPPPAPKPATPPVVRATAPPAATPLENLPVECHVAKIGLPGSEELFLQGSIRNDRPEGLQSATIEIRLPEGSQQRVVQIVFGVLAPQGRLPFMTSCPVPLEENYKPEALAVAAVPLGPKRVCWGVDAAAVKGDDSGEVRTVIGSVRNRLDVRISNIEVHADVFFDDGRPAGTARGKLEHSTMLDPGARDDFSLSFTPKNVGTRIQRPVVRAVGTIP